MYKRKRIRYINMADFNIRLAYCRKNCIIYFSSPTIGKIGSFNAYIEEGLSMVKLTYYSEEGVTTYVAHMDALEEEYLQEITGGVAFATVSKYYKIPRYRTLTTKDESYPGMHHSLIVFSAKPFVWFNPDYNESRNHVYYYDLNSAYGYIMANYKFPNTAIDPVQKFVEDGEIGFDADGELVPKGEFGLYVFPEMETPFKKFAEHWYKKKRDAKNLSDKNKAKNILCYSVGYMQLVNPFLRSFIINSCNELIKSLMNPKRTLYCNTDCIVSLDPLPLKIGKELGEWKFRECEFAYFNTVYQINKERPVWKGIPRGWWEDHPNFDILKDTPPHDNNLYAFNVETFQYERRIKND